MRGGLRSNFFRVHRIVISRDDIIIDPVFDMKRRVGYAEDPLIVRFIFREQQRNISLTIQIPLTQLGMGGRDHFPTVFARELLQRRFRCTWPPGPGVAKPQAGQEMDGDRIRPAINHADLNKQVFSSVLAIFYEDIEIAVFVEDTRVQQFVLHIVTTATLVRLDQIVVGVLRLWILVQVFHVRVCGCAVEIKVVLLNILTVVALAVCQTEHPFFKDGVLTVPQGHAEA